MENETLNIKTHVWNLYFSQFLFPSIVLRMQLALQTHHSLSPLSPWQQRGHAGAYGSSFSLCLPRLGSPGGIYTSLISPSLFSSTAVLITHPITFSSFSYAPKWPSTYCTYTASRLSSPTFGTTIPSVWTGKTTAFLQKRCHIKGRR